MMLSGRSHLFYDTQTLRKLELQTGLTDNNNILKLPIMELTKLKSERPALLVLSYKSISIYDIQGRVELWYADSTHVIKIKWCQRQCVSVIYYFEGSDRSVKLKYIFLEESNFGTLMQNFIKRSPYSPQWQFILVDLQKGEKNSKYNPSTAYRLQGKNGLFWLVREKNRSFSNYVQLGLLDSGLEILDRNENTVLDIKGTHFNILWSEDQHMLQIENINTNSPKKKQVANYYTHPITGRAIRQFFLKHSEQGRTDQPTTTETDDAASVQLQQYPKKGKQSTSHTNTYDSDITVIESESNDIIVSESSVQKEIPHSVTSSEENNSELDFQ
jgi:hypothetical protein